MPAFARRHYETVARVVKETIRETDDPKVVAPGATLAVRTGVELLAHNLANAFAQDNPGFDRARFLRACGLAAQE